MLNIILITFVFCFTLERLIPGWKLPNVKTWPKRVLFINVLQLGVVLLAGVTWEIWFSKYSIFNLSEFLNPLAGGAVAYFIATFVFYWWHRKRHESDFLWRMYHQIHHSPQRLEVITSFYKHPQEMIVNSIIGSLLVYVFLGLDPMTGGVYTLFTALGEFFYHTNIKTPRWVGFFFQRPEMHRIHHQYGRHKNNYGDITWWDMLFGTYENPKEWKGRCGFDEENENRLLDMLKLIDVHKFPLTSVATEKHKIQDQNNFKKDNFKFNQNMNGTTAMKSSKTGTQKITAILTSTLVALSMITAEKDAIACSAFANDFGKDSFIIAKNFDWLSGEGYLVQNPRNTIRKSLQKEAGINWTSRYGSISFTTLGPGLPISSMNEKGLVIEALVDKDYSGKLQNHGNLLSLEWAQYALDNYSTTDQVVEFANEHSFDQMVVGLHFFVCDKSRKCAVIESSQEDPKLLSVLHGSSLKQNVLANRNWKNDYPEAKKFNLKKNHLFNWDFLPRFLSYKRFAALSEASELDSVPTLSEAFSTLDRAKITKLIQWQIIWEPEKKSVYWRTFDGSDPSRVLSLSPRDISYKCTDKTQVVALGGTSVGKFRNFDKNDSKLVQSRLKKVLQWRLGRTNDIFEKQIAAFTLSPKCKIN